MTANNLSHTITATSAISAEPDLTLDTVALLAARYALNPDAFEATFPGTRAEQAARRARDEVAWATRTNRLAELYQKLNNGEPHPVAAGAR